MKWPKAVWWREFWPHILHGVFWHGCHCLHRWQILTSCTIDKRWRGRWGWGGRICGTWTGGKMIKSKSMIVTRTKISMKLTVMVVIKELDMLLLVLLVMAPLWEKSFSINIQNPFQRTNPVLLHYACMIKYNMSNRLTKPQIEIHSAAVDLLSMILLRKDDLQVCWCCRYPKFGSRII